MESDNQHLKDQIYSLVNDKCCGSCKISNKGNEFDNIINNKDISREINNNNNNNNNNDKNDKNSNNNDIILMKKNFIAWKPMTSLM